MISLNKIDGVQNIHVLEFCGTSTDFPLPIGWYKNMFIENGSRFHNMTNGEIWMYDQENQNWINQGKITNDGTCDDCPPDTAIRLSNAESQLASAQNQLNNVVEKVDGIEQGIVEL